MVNPIRSVLSCGNRRTRVSRMRTGPDRWSSKLGFYLAAPGAAVGLGSIWRFPYLTGTNGGSAFVFVFILACLAIATPLLVAEFIIGRQSRRNPAEAAGEVAASFGRSRRWNAIGVRGTGAAFFLMSCF